ncbi:MAG: 4-hydroxy-tetrahydrodipicolinate synthase [Calditrichaeota bacterium]|nr:4-hydroxy-tetrahydrodipicolinate synthase [Calditrichota bacterium]
MSRQSLSAGQLAGVWTALVTPFTRGRIDTGRLGELVEQAAGAGLTGVVPCGTTGESPSLERREWELVVGTVVNSASGRLKVIAGAGTNNTRHTIELIHRAAELGADGVLIVVPYYNKPTGEGLRRHFLAAAEASPVPMVLYHIPTRSGTGLSIGLTLELARHPNIIGIKDAGGEVRRVAEIARQVPMEFAVLSGDDPLTLPMMAIGATGVVSVVSNLKPRTVGQLVALALRGQFSEALSIDRALAPLYEALFLETNPAPVKEAMNLVGLRVGPVRLPLAPVASATRARIRAALAATAHLE